MTLRQRSCLLFHLGLLFLASLVFLPATLLQAEEYYVAISYGNDDHDGKSVAQAFKTIAKASQEMMPGDTCYIRHGHYPETIVPLKDDVTYRPYLSERPVIVAGQQLSETQGLQPFAPLLTPMTPPSWVKAQNQEVPGASNGGGDTTDTDHVWKMVIPDELDLSQEFESHGMDYLTDGRFSQLYVKDVAMVEARWPNITVEANAATPTMVHMPRAYAQFGTTGTRLLHEDLTAAGFHGGLNGARIHIIPGAEWIPFSTSISNYGNGGLDFDFPLAIDIQRPEPEVNEDPTDPEIAHNYGWEDWPGNQNTGNDSYIPEQGDPFYLFDHINLLDAPGEWYVKPAVKDMQGNILESAVIYFWCPYGDPNTLDVFIKTSSSVAIINKHSEVKFRDLRFLGGGVSMFGTDTETHDNVVANCSFRYVNHSRDCLGFQTDTWSGNGISGKDNTFSHCRIEHAGRTGIRDKGTNTVIAGCIVSDVDYDGAHTGAIRLADGSAHASVWYNTLFNSGRHIIYFEGSRNFNIAHNECGHAGFLSSDCGNIYTWGTDHGGGSIHHNFVHHNHSTHFPAGIYFDAFGEFDNDASRLAPSENCKVYKNFVSDINYAAFYVVSSSYNINLYNNTHDATSTVAPEMTFSYQRQPHDAAAVPGALRFASTSTDHGKLKLHQLDATGESINAYMRTVESARIEIFGGGETVKMQMVLPSAIDPVTPSFHGIGVEITEASASIPMGVPLTVRITPEPVSLRHHEHGNGTGAQTIPDWTDCKMLNNIFNGIVDPVADNDGTTPDRLPLFDRNLASDLYPNGLPVEGSPAINFAIILPGINTPYVVPAPDCGCYEFGHAKWTYGDENSGLPEPMKWWP